MLQRFDNQFLRDLRNPIKLREAAPVAEETVVPIPPPPPTFSESELEAAKAGGQKIGYASGFEAGLQQAATETAAREKDMAAALAAIVQQFQALGAAHQEFLTKQTEEVSELALLIARKVAEEALDARGVETITALVSKCLPIFLEKPKVTIELHPDTIDNAKEPIRALLAQHGFEGDAQFRANETLSKHDARVEWGAGQATRSSQALWQTIEALLYQNKAATEPTQQPTT